MPQNILMVDDASAPATEIRAALAAAGYAVQAVRSIEQVFAAIAERPVALALLAVGDSFPGGVPDGLELARRLQSDERTAAVPVAFLAVSAEEALRIVADPRAGDIADLIFPFQSAESVVQQVRVLLARAAHGAARGRRAQLDTLMIAALLHDMRTPLAALTLNAELVVRRADLPAVQQAGVRMKSATAMLGRQAEHLVNLAITPRPSLPPTLEPVDLAVLLRERVRAAAAQQPHGPAFNVDIQGEALGEFDRAMIADAIDRLLHLATAHGNRAAVRVQLDGGLRRALVLSVAMDTVIDEGARELLFGGTQAEVEAGLPAPHVGPGLERIERIARAHCGSLIGRSREPEGTIFELLLPRSVA
jgi:two-component system, sensor histidine kinase and response regulator